MKKLRLLLKLLGIVALLVGLSSCKKSDSKDDDTKDCFTCEFDGADDEEYCKSDDDWEDYADTWEDYVAFIKVIDNASDEMDCDF